MRALAENWKQIFLCLPLWFWHLVGGFLCVIALVHALQNPVPGSGHLAALLVVPFWSGFLFASIQKELLLKPFVFALPNHRDVARRALLLLGAAASVLPALTILSCPGLPPLQTTAAFLSFATSGFTLFALIAGWIFWTDNASALTGVFVGSGFLLAKVPGAGAALEKATLFHPFAGTALACLAAILLWRWLGSASVTRRLCGRRFLPLQSAWNIEAQRRFGLGRKIDELQRRGGAGRQWLERFSLAAMHRRPALSLRRYLAGCRYQALGDLLPYPLRSWGYAALLWTAIFTVLGYGPPHEGRSVSPVNLALLMPAILGSCLPMPTFSTMLLPAGRRERFWGTVAAAALGALLTMVLTLLIWAFYLFPGRLLPVLNLSGQSYPFHQPNDSLFYLSLVVLPFLYTSNLVFRRWAFVPSLIVFIVFFLLVAQSAKGLAGLGPAGAAILLGASWAFFLLIARLICMRSDLVR